MSKPVWIALIGGVLFAGVAIHEWSYKGAHPHAYGPAAVIALAGVAGALLAGVIAWVIGELDRRDERIWQRLSEHGRSLRELAGEAEKMRAVAVADEEASELLALLDDDSE